MNGCKLYFRYLRVHLLSALEYRGWWLLVVQVAFSCIAEPLGTILLFLRFGRVGEWSVERLLLVYAMAATSFGLAKTFCRGLDNFPFRMVRGGDFDRLLLRPRSLCLQASASVFHLHRAAQPVVGLALILWSLWRQDIAPTPLRVLILVLALAGGFATYTGVFAMTSGISFFTVKAVDWITVFTNASCQVARIPHPYLPGALKDLFTFFMPLLVAAYYPAAVACGWGESLWTAFLALPAGLAFLGLGLVVWRFGIRHYQSTGS